MRYDLIMVDLILKSTITHITPKNIVEIGSRDGHDTNALKQLFNIPSQNCYIFEAHPDCFNYIKNTYPDFNIFNCAVTNKTGLIKFNAGVIGEEGNIGMSSILKQTSGEFKSREIEVDGWRFEEICNEIKLADIDLVKIDVEGHSLEVLEGFGDILENTKIIQIELEHKQIWNNQHTYDAVKDFLLSKNFEEVCLIRHSWTQSDSLWIRSNHINKN